jgi:LysM repeat protein
VPRLQATLQPTIVSATPTTAALVVPTATVAATPVIRATVIVPLAPVVPPMPPLPGTTSAEGSIVAVYTSYFTYVVRPGDTVNRLATQFGVSGDAIVHASGLSDPNLLLPGQALTIPRGSGWLYRVQPNETLEQIALRFGTTVDDLLAASMLSSTVVRAGELLFIPSGIK